MKNLKSKILNGLFKIWVFLLSIPLVLIYVPIRGIVRQFRKIVLKKHDVKHHYQGHNRTLLALEKGALGSNETAQTNRNFIYFILAAITPYLLFVIVPFLMGIYFSFTNWTGLNTGNEIFIGFANYKNIFSSFAFAYSFYRTAIYSVLNIIFINLVAFLLALLVTQKLKLTNVYRAGFFMPNLIGGLVLGYIWQFIYRNALPSIGGILTNSLISNPDTAMGALIVVITWQYAGYIMMIYIAALQNVPTDLIEASKIDGANAWQRLRTITMPLVAQAFTIAMFLTLVTSFKQYDTVMALTQGGPATTLPQFLQNIFAAPNRTVESLNLMAINIYDSAFVRYEMGVGQAKAIIFFIILLIISLTQVYYNKKKEVEL